MSEKPGARPDDWEVRCMTCGLRRDAREGGVYGQRWASAGQCTVLWCSRCRRLRCHAVRRKYARGLCPACGYDVRASKDRCPECGEKLR